MALEQLDYDYTIHQRDNAGDETLAVKFFMRPELDQAETLKQGRKIFKDTECIDIRVPGSKDMTTRPIRQSDLQRFPRHYAAFKARISEPVIGTLLEAWPNPGMSPARIAELNALNIRTVEQIVAAPDSVTSLFMGYQTLKTSAQLFIDASKSAAPLAEMQAKLETALLKIEEQGREVARLTAIANEKPNTLHLNKGK